jgi:hypothetical protein
MNSTVLEVPFISIIIIPNKIIILRVLAVKEMFGTVILEKREKLQEGGREMALESNKGRKVPAPSSTQTSMYEPCALVLLGGLSQPPLKA